MNQSVEKFILGPLETCTYLVDGKFLIDPAGVNSELEYKLEGAAGELEAILLTHAHADHFAGLNKILQIYPDCPVYCHRTAAEILSDPERNLSAWLGEENSYDSAIPVSEESGLPLEEGPEIIHTPGHSPGSVSYYWSEENRLFCGDVLFSGGIGRTDLPGGDMGKLKETIEEELFVLPGGTQIYPGHGPETTVEKEKNHNPYLNQRD